VLLGCRNAAPSREKENQSRSFKFRASARSPAGGRLATSGKGTENQALDHARCKIETVVSDPLEQDKRTATWQNQDSRFKGHEKQNPEAGSERL
jgi:hypothetical protein